MNSIIFKDFPKKYRTSNFALFLRFPAFQTFSSRSFPSSSSSHWMWWSTHGSSSFHPSSILWFLSMLSEFLEQFLPRIPSLMKHYNRSQSHNLKFMCSSDKNQHFLKEILFRNRSALIATTTRRERRQMFIASILITIIFIYAICHRWSIG